MKNVSKIQRIESHHWDSMTSSKTLPWRVEMVDLSKVSSARRNCPHPFKEANSAACRFDAEIWIYPIL